MSRIGNKPIEIPQGITVTVEGNKVKGKGPQGELVLEIPSLITAKVADSKIQVSPKEENTKAGSLHGTTRTLLANMVHGLQKGYTKELEIQGVGFKAQIQGQKLVLSLGFSHQIDFEVPKGVTVKVQDGTALVVSGPNRQQVGEVSARIRGYYPAEPYKGKGVRYKGEHVRRKAGKAVA